MSKRREDSGRDKGEENSKLHAWPYYLFYFITFASLACCILTLFPGAGLSAYEYWLDSLFLVLLTAGTLLSLSRQLPWQNVFLVAGIIAVVGGGVHMLGVTYSIPFGPFLYSKNAGPKMFGILPWFVPLFWVSMVLTARGVARLMLRPWRKARIYGFRLMGMTIALTILLDMALDPFCNSNKLDLWVWTPTKLPITWHGAPLVNFISIGAITLLMLAFTTPSLIRKQPGQKSGPEYFPLVIWIGLLLWFGSAAGMAGHWTALGLDAVVGIAVLFFSIRGARW